MEKWEEFSWMNVFGLSPAPPQNVFLSLCLDSAHQLFTNLAFATNRYLVAHLMPWNHLSWDRLEWIQLYGSCRIQRWRLTRKEIWDGAGPDAECGPLWEELESTAPLRYCSASFRSDNRSKKENASKQSLPFFFSFSVSQAFKP